MLMRICDVAEARDLALRVEGPQMQLDVVDDAAGGAHRDLDVDHRGRHGVVGEDALRLEAADVERAQRFEEVRYLRPALARRQPWDAVIDGIVLPLHILA